MFRTLLSALKLTASNDQSHSRRQYPRRELDSCVVDIHGRAFPVENWSLGGVLLCADDRLFGINQPIDLTLKFKLRDKIVDVEHIGRVVRKGSGHVAIKFKPITRTIHRTFQNIIDDHTAHQFASSQAG